MNNVFNHGEDSFSFFFVPRYFVSGVCFIFICPVFLNWVCWVCGIFSGEPGHVYISCVCLRCVECRVGTSLFGHSGGVDGGTVRIFLSLWLCSGGYGTVEMVRGVVRFSSAFFSLLSVFLAVGCLR